MPVMHIIPRRPGHLEARGQARTTVFTLYWRMARRAFGIWRQRNDLRTVLSDMTERELADIGMTMCDRAMALACRKWTDPNSNRNITLTHGWPRFM
jgi:uncharacterized protein YjiS (DUF1127 family)